MPRIVQAMLIGAVVGLVVGGAAKFVLPALGLTKFAFPIVIGAVTGLTSAFISTSHRERVPLPRSENS
jgi:hypothetical protein